MRLGEWLAWLMACPGMGFLAGAGFDWTGALQAWSFLAGLLLMALGGLAEARIVDAMGGTPVSATIGPLTWDSRVCSDRPSSLVNRLQAAFVLAQHSGPEPGRGFSFHRADNNERVRLPPAPRFQAGSATWADAVPAQMESE